MIQLFGHPFSSYTQKALIALYENDTLFDCRMLDPEHLENGDELARHSPAGKFPLLIDGTRAVVEASTIIEYLDSHHAGAVRFIPDDRDSALDVRVMDRVFDNYVMAPMQCFVSNALRPEQERDPKFVARAAHDLDRIYAWLDTRVGGDRWAVGDTLTLADCAAAPSLFYADWVRPIPPEHASLKAYRARLLAHPSVARCVDEARPYRHLFPPGAPDRD